MFAIMSGVAVLIAVLIAAPLARKIAKPEPSAPVAAA
jgi:hypothetical protein